MRNSRSKSADIHYINGTPGETVASFEFEAIRLGDAICSHKLDRWLPADAAIWICAADRRRLLAVIGSGGQTKRSEVAGLAAGRKPGQLSS